MNSLKHHIVVFKYLVILYTVPIILFPCGHLICIHKNLFRTLKDQIFFPAKYAVQIGKDVYSATVGWEVWYISLPSGRVAIDSNVSFP